MARLIPIFTNPDLSDENNRFGFEPFEKDVGPCAWAWVDDSARVEYLPARGYLMLTQPNKSPRFAHELFFESWNQGELPIDPPEGLDQ